MKTKITLLFAVIVLVSAFRQDKPAGNPRIEKGMSKCPSFILREKAKHLIGTTTLTNIFQW